MKVDVVAVQPVGKVDTGKGIYSEVVAEIIPIRVTDEVVAVDNDSAKRVVVNVVDISID